MVHFRLALQLSTVVCVFVALGLSIAVAADPGPEALAKARKAYDQGNWTQAAGLYEQAFKISPKKSVTRVEATLEHGALLWEQGRYAKAYKKTQTSIALARDLKLNRALGRLLLTLGQIETSQGKLASAHRTLRLCVVESKAQKDVIYGSLCALNVSLVQRLQGKRGLSDARVRQTIATLKAAKTPRAAGLAMAKTADLYRKNKSHAQAMQLLVQAQAQFKQAGSVPAQTRNLLRMAQVLQDQNQWAAAQTKLNVALPALQKMKNRPLLQQAYGMLGRSAQQNGKREVASAHYAKALTYAKSTGSPQLVAQSHLALCELFSSPQPSNRAEAHCAGAAKGFKRIGAKGLHVRALVRLANIRQQQRQLPQARGMYLQSIKLLKSSPKTKENKKVLATQYANLCQVEHTLRYTGSFKTCTLALNALSGLPKADQPHEYIAATHYAAAFGAEREKRFKNALFHFKKAGAVYASLTTPNWMRAADAQLRLGTLLTQLKKKEKSAVAALELGLKWVDLATEKDAKLVKQQLLLQLGQHFLYEKQYARAVTRLEQLILAAPNDPDTQAWAYNGLAHAKVKLGEKGAAITALKKGIAVGAKGKDKHQIRALMKKNLKVLEQ